MTGRSYFNEVFLTDARVTAEDLVGGEGNGWAVANTTLAYERALSGGGELGATADPGPIAGNLDRPRRRVRPARTRPNTPSGVRAPVGDPGDSGRADCGRNREPLVRDGLVRLYTLERLNTLNTQRARALEQAGRSLPGLPQLAKMAQNHALRLGRDLTFTLLQSAGTLHAYAEGGAAELEARPASKGSGPWSRRALFAQGPPIYGGSDQIQRNIVGDRVLGLPREPSVEAGLPFRGSS